MHTERLEIANTGYSNNMDGWNALVSDLASNMSINGCNQELADYMAIICRWNDHNGNWDREDGQTISDYCHELHSIMVRWSQDVQA